MCAQKLTDASLIYRTEPETKTEIKSTKNENGYRVCSEETVGYRARNCGVSPEGAKESLGWKGFVKQVRFQPGVKKRRNDGW